MSDTTETAESQQEGASGEGVIPAASLRNAEDLQIEVEIRDERKLFGRRDYLISPVSGSGEAWVAAHNVETAEEDEG